MIKLTLDNMQVDFSNVEELASFLKYKQEVKPQQRKCVFCGKELWGKRWKLCGAKECFDKNSSAYYQEHKNKIKVQNNKWYHEHVTPELQKTVAIKVNAN